jgi:hypothetical protein
MARVNTPPPNRNADLVAAQVGAMLGSKQGKLQNEDYFLWQDFATVLDEFEAQAFINQAPRDAFVAAHRVPSDLPIIGARCSWRGNRWRFDYDGVPTAILAVVDAIDRAEPETIDFMAWPMAEPSRFGLACGNAIGLGVSNVDHAGTCVWNEPLTVHRTPLAWCIGRGRGLLLLHTHDVSPVLSRAHGRILAEDREHALELARLTRGSPFLSPDRIGFDPGRP